MDINQVPIFEERNPSKQLWMRYEGNPEIERIRFGANYDVKASIQVVYKCIKLTLQVGWAEMCGRRPDMQDAMTVLPNFRGVQTQHFVALFDGHSGNSVSMVIFINYCLF